MQSDSIAQTFIVDVTENITGCFLTSIDLYFKSKSRNDNTGVEVFICETENGIPDISSALGSSYRKSNQIRTSDDASLHTTFFFRTPVFVNNIQEYAIVIKVDGSAPDFEIWCTEIGGTDILTGETVNANPRTGTLYISGNDLAWTPIQTEDLKFFLQRAVFTQPEGKLVLENERDEYVTFDNLTKFGGNSILPGDIVVLEKPDETPQTNQNATNFYAGEVQFLDETNSKMIINKSNGKLIANRTYQIHRPNSTENTVFLTAANSLLVNNNVHDSANNESNASKVAKFTLESIDNLEYHAVVPKFIDMVPEKTSVEYKFKGTSNNFIEDSNLTDVTNNYEKEFDDYERILISRTNEIVENTGKSSRFEITLKTNNRYLSPVIDVRSPQAIFVKNLINNDSTNEHTKYGNALTKYISKTTTLDASLGEAEDMLAFIGAYRPKRSNIELYIKVKNSNDQDSFDSKLWTKMVLTSGNSIFSETGNKLDLREYQYGIPEGTSNSSYVPEDGESGSTAYLNNGILEYKNADGGVFIGYSQFAFKIVFLSSDATFVPLLNDFRSLSLQK